MPTKHTIAQAKYDALHRRNYGLRLHNDIDKDIIDKLASVPSMQGYIKQLIRADIDGTVSVPLSKTTLEVLSEIAAKQGTTVPELISVIVNNDIVRTFRQNTST